MVKVICLVFVCVLLRFGLVVFNFSEVSFFVIKSGMLFFYFNCLVKYGSFFILLMGCVFFIVCRYGSVVMFVLIFVVK